VGRVEHVVTECAKSQAKFDILIVRRIIVIGEPAQGVPQGFPDEQGAT
jgi:hypothetical protein